MDVSQEQGDAHASVLDMGAVFVARSKVVNLVLEVNQDDAFRTAEVRNVLIQVAVEQPFCRRIWCCVEFTPELIKLDKK
eukprot:snap_masked-scaffold_15-processed-gene-5.20-mRNA-1 protein AED:0.35 eAED:1.00 QI:0/-1/0/1/-1/1/1/0/78